MRERNSQEFRARRDVAVNSDRNVAVNRAKNFDANRERNVAMNRTRNADVNRFRNTNEFRSRNNVAFNRERNFNRTENAAFYRRGNVRITNSWRGDAFRGQRYAAFRNYHRQWHDRSWWRSHCNRIVFVNAGWYYWKRQRSVARAVGNCYRKCGCSANEDDASARHALGRLTGWWFSFGICSRILEESRASQSATRSAENDQQPETAGSAC